MKTITNMTDEELREGYLYYCDGITETVKRLRDAAANNFQIARETWFSNLAYRFRCLTDIQEEMERRSLNAEVCNNSRGN